MYLGRFQQGEELLLTLQCVSVHSAPLDPLVVPVATIYRDGATPTFIETRALAADLRGVEDGVFRHPIFLGSLYATAGRYLVIFRYTDGNGVGRSVPGSFYLLPGGSQDGQVIALHYARRPDANYLLAQHDSGRLTRGRNPR